MEPKDRYLTMKKVLLSLFLAILFFWASFVTAQTDVVLLSPLPGTGGSTNFDTYAPVLFNLAIGIAGVLAVIMMIVGGLQYMSTDAMSGKTEGKERITAALGGLALALIAFILLQTINTGLVNFNLPVLRFGVTRATIPGTGMRSTVPGDLQPGCIIQAASIICLTGGGTFADGACTGNSPSLGSRCCTTGGATTWVTPQVVCPP